MTTTKKDIRINDTITIRNCSLCAFAGIGDDLYTYYLKKVDDEEQAILIDSGILDEGEEWVTLRTINGVYNDDSWYVGHKSLDDCIRYICCGTNVILC